MIKVISDKRDAQNTHMARKMSTLNTKALYVANQATVGNISAKQVSP